MKRLHVDGRLCCSVAAPCTEHIGSPAFELPLPRCDLVGVDIELLRKLSQCSIAFDGGKRHFRFENRCMVPARSSGHGLSCFAVAQRACCQAETPPIVLYRFPGPALSDYDRAIVDYTEAIRLDPKFAFAYNNRCNAYHRKGDNDRAIADCTEAIRLDPKYAFAYNNRGLAYAGKGDYDRAIVDYTEAIRLDPKYALAYNNRGNAYFKKGDYDRAISDYTEAIRLDPKLASALYWRGVAKQRKGDKRGGDSDIAAARSIDPKVGN